MLPTPDFGHLSSDDYTNVYEPAEDTFLLIDAIEKQEKFIKSLRPAVCVEVGTGSGVCITFLAQLIGPNCLYIGTDVNPRAVEISLQTAQRNSVRLEMVQTDLVTSLTPRLFGAVDILIFNPPYVVTPSEEVGGTGIEASWAGGTKGREVTDRLLSIVHQLLSSKGAFYLLIIKENDQDDLARVMKGYGFDMSVVMSRRSGPEFLSVLRFVRLKEQTVPTG